MNIFKITIKYVLMSEEAHICECPCVCTRADCYSIDNQLMSTKFLNGFVSLVEVPHQNSFVPRGTKYPSTTWITKHLEDRWKQSSEEIRPENTRVHVKCITALDSITPLSVCAHTVLTLP